VLCAVLIFALLIAKWLFCLHRLSKFENSSVNSATGTDATTRRQTARIVDIWATGINKIFLTTMIKLKNIEKRGPNIVRNWCFHFTFSKLLQHINISVSLWWPNESAQNACPCVRKSRRPTFGMSIAGDPFPSLPYLFPFISSSRVPQSGASL